MLQIYDLTICIYLINDGGRLVYLETLRGTFKSQDFEIYVLQVENLNLFVQHPSS